VADGETALAFSRMRYSDPKGDIGRAERQQQVIAAVADKVVKPSVLLNPINQVQLVNAGTDALTVDEDTGIVNLGQLALAFKGATGSEGVTGTPPIADPGYDPGTGVGSTVLLDEETVGQFWTDVRDGNLEAGSTVGGLPG
jgi:anionic cell wall polymer biosynthesis LytR-Cps2A-Psr (LCP) family protein